jgi:hypothetical protein
MKIKEEFQLRVKGQSALRLPSQVVVTVTVESVDAGAGVKTYEALKRATEQLNAEADR